MTKYCVFIVIVCAKEAGANQCSAVSYVSLPAQQSCVNTVLLVKYLYWLCCGIGSASIDCARVNRFFNLDLFKNNPRLCV